MFTQFTFRNFKSFRESILPVSPVTIIIGSNASGKSNAIEGINLFSQLSFMDLPVLINGARGISPVVRGGADKISFLGGDWFELECTLKRDEDKFDYKIKVRVKPEIELISEELILFDEGSSETVLKVGENSWIICPNDMSERLPETPWKSSFLRTFLYSNFRNIEDFSKHLLSIFSFNPDPTVMKEYVSIIAQTLSLESDGSNLSAIVGRLIQDEKMHSTLLEMLQDLPEQKIENIGLLKATSSKMDIEDVMLFVEERLGNKKMSFSARTLSDGTLRYLAILAALLDDFTGTMLTIEDIDAGIHPERLKKLLSFISQTARKKNMSIIATTHNPALLNSLAREDIPGVVVCYRDPDEGDSRFIRLVDIPSYPELMATGRLGDLLARGLLEKAVHETEADREKEYEEKLNWIKEEME